MFVCVKDAQLKKQIRHLLEEDDYTYFQKNRSNETIPWDKEYLEKAPYLIVMFLQVFSRFSVLIFKYPSFKKKTKKINPRNIHLIMMEFKGGILFRIWALQLQLVY